MNKKLYKFLTIGSASIAAVSGIAFVVSCGSKSSISSSTSTNFAPREVRTYAQWAKDFPQFKDKIENSKVVDEAFADQTLPKNFYLPDGVNEIGVGAFRGAKISQGFEFPYALLVINKYAFQGASLPDGFEIPKDLRTIASFAFADIEIPNNMQFDMYSKSFSVSPSAFANAKFKEDQTTHESSKVSLTTFFGIKSNGATNLVAKDGTTDKTGNINDWSYPPKLTKIPDYAFSNSVIGDKFEFPFWVTTIGAYAFYGATLPVNFQVKLNATNNAASIQTGAFQLANIGKWFTIVNTGGDKPLVDPTAFSGAVTTGLTFDKYTFDVMNDGGANLPNTQTKVTSLHDAMTQTGHIKAYAYAGIDFRNTPEHPAIAGALQVLEDLKTTPVKAIDKSAFAGAIFPDTFVFPSVESIDYNAFLDATFLGAITVPSSVTKMATGVFQNATGTTMEFNANIKSLPESTFSINDANSAIGIANFATQEAKYRADEARLRAENNDSAAEVAKAKADDFKSQHDNAVQKGFLGGIKFGSNAMTSIEQIESSALNGQTLKADFAFPTSLKTLANGAMRFVNFEEKVSMTYTNLIIQNEVFLGSTFNKGIDLSGVTLVENAAHDALFGDGVFSGVHIGTGGNIVLPSNITAISKNTFANVELPAQFSIPQTIKSIGAFAFTNAKLNDSFTLKDLSLLKEIGKSAFSGKGNTVDEYTGKSSYVRTMIPAGFEFPTGKTLKTIRSGAFAFTDWTNNTHTGLKPLESDFNYNETAIDGILEAGIFQGTKLNNTFELPGKLDFISSGMFQFAEMPSVTALVTNNFVNIKTIGSAAFQGAKIGFNLDQFTKLEKIMSSAFQETEILLTPQFNIPDRAIVIEVKAFFSTYTLVDGTDWEGKPAKVQRTVDWFKMDNGVEVKAEANNGNPLPGSYAKQSGIDFIASTTSTSVAPKV